MNAEDQLRLEIVCKVESGLVDRAFACQHLRVSARTLGRWIAEFREEGAAFLLHGNRAKAPANKTPEAVKANAMRLMSEKYFDFNMVHASEKIREELGRKIPRETFRRWCHEIGAVKHKQKRRAKPRARRARYPQAGYMLQMDGSHHRWFDGRETCLIAAIDDATSEVVGAQFFEGETTWGCLTVLRAIVESRGAFRVLYVDKAGVFGGIKRQGFSQVGRAMEEIGTQTIFAHSPEAKGRIERLFRTMQDRLVPEMRLNKIRTIEQANEYLQRIYLPTMHNPSFAVQAQDTKPAWMALRAGVRADEVFCVKEHRIAGKDATFSLGGRTFMVADQLRFSIHRQRIEIRYAADGSWSAYLAGQPMKTVLVEKLKKMAA